MPTPHACACAWALRIQEKLRDKQLKEEVTLQAGGLTGWIEKR